MSIIPFVIGGGNTSGSGSGEGETNTGSSLGGGANVYKNKSGPTLNFRSLVGGGVVKVAENGDTILVSANGGVGGGFTESSAQSLIDVAVTGLITETSADTKYQPIGSYLSADTVLFTEASADTKYQLVGNYLQTDNITANLDFNNYRITNVSDPALPQDVATKIYVDAAINGLDWKASVKLATTENVALTGEQTIDGESIVSGERILVKDQTDATENGIYVVNSGGWTRSTDADNTPENEISAGMSVYVEEGTLNAGTNWVLNSPNGLVELGTDNIAFTQFGGVNSSILNAAINTSLIGYMTEASADAAYLSAGTVLQPSFVNLSATYYDFNNVAWASLEGQYRFETTGVNLVNAPFSANAAAVYTILAEVHNCPVTNTHFVRLNLASFGDWGNNNRLFVRMGPDFSSSISLGWKEYINDDDLISRGYITQATADAAYLSANTPIGGLTDASAQTLIESYGYLTEASSDAAYLKLEGNTTPVRVSAVSSLTFNINDGVGSANGTLTLSEGTFTLAPWNTLILSPGGAASVGNILVGTSASKATNVKLGNESGTTIIAGSALSFNGVTFPSTLGTDGQILEIQSGELQWVDKPTGAGGGFTEASAEAMFVQASSNTTLNMFRSGGSGYTYIVDNGTFSLTNVGVGGGMIDIGYSTPFFQTYLGAIGSFTYINSIQWPTAYPGVNQTLQFNGVALEWVNMPAEYTPEFNETRVSATTTTASLTPIWEADLDVGDVVAYEGTFTAANISNLGESSKFHIKFGAVNIAGAVSLIGNTFELVQTGTSYNMQADISGNSVHINAVGEAATTVQWLGSVKEIK
jgi:hypothetical protein